MEAETAPCRNEPADMGCTDSTTAYTAPEGGCKRSLTALNTVYSRVQDSQYLSVSSLTGGYKLQVCAKDLNQSQVVSSSSSSRADTLI